MKILSGLFAYFPKINSLVSKKKSLQEPFFLRGEKALQQENFGEYIDYLCLLGISLQRSFSSQRLKDKKSGEKRYAEEERDFREYITDYFVSQLPDSSLGKLPFGEHSVEKQLAVSLKKLRYLLLAWDDPGLDRKDKAKQRPRIKFKKNVDKPIRRLIKHALYAEVVRMLVQISQLKLKVEYVVVEDLIKKIDSQWSAAEETEKIHRELADIVSNCLRLLQKLEPTLNLSLSEEVHRETLSKAARAITSFKTTTDKILSFFSHFTAILVGLACGFTTGGAIFLLLGSFGIGLPIVIPLGILVFAAGFRSNFRFFAQSMTEFLLKLNKRGGITEYIDEEGKRVRTSLFKKFLLLPAALVSLSVGISVAAFTVTTSLKIAAAFALLVGWACPPLALAIAWTLAITLGVGLSIIMFQAFVGALQRSVSLHKLYQAVVEALKKPTFTGFLAYLAKGIVVAFAIFGLYFLCSAGIATLAEIAGSTIASVITWASFLGQIPFVIVTVSGFCNSVADFVGTNVSKVVKFCFGSQSNQATRTNEFQSTSTTGFFKRVFEFLGLVINALGNAVLVVGHSISSYVAGAACFLNSYAGNLIGQDTSEQSERKKATDAILDNLKQDPYAVDNNRNNNIRQPVATSPPIPCAPLLSRTHTTVGFFFSQGSAVSSAPANSSSEHQRFLSSSLRVSSPP